MSRQGIIFTFLLSLVGGLFGWWFYNNFEYVPREVWLGFRGEARTNHLLAAGHFLRRMGIEAQSIEGPQTLDQLPETNSTLLIATERTTLSDKRSQALLDWVKAGGHLILRPRRPIAEVEPDPDPLLDPLGITAYTPPQKVQFDPEDDGEPAPEASEGECPAPFTYINLPEADDPLEIEFNQDWTLSSDTPDPTWQYSDSQGHRALQYPWGKGHITVLSEMFFFDNHHIGNSDHAHLLYWLARQQPGQFWLMHSDDLPPLWLWLWRRAPTVVIAAGLLLLFWLLRAPRRFGPLLPPVPTRRRRIMEHIDAGGHFLWKHGQAEILLGGLRDALHLRLHRARPDLAGLPADKLSRHLAELTGIGQKQIQQALLDTAALNRDTFTRQIQILDNIRKQL